MNSYVATFYTYYGAMKFDKICKRLQISSKLMPVPRKLSSSCGTCVFFSAESFEKTFSGVDIEDLEGCYFVVGKEFKALK